MNKKNIVAYVLVCVLPALAAGIVILKISVAEPRSSLVWVPLVIALVGTFGAEFLVKWLRKRLGGVMEAEPLGFNLLVLTLALVSLFFNASALLLVYMTGRKIWALLMVIVGLVYAVLAARDVLRAK